MALSLRDEDPIVIELVGGPRDGTQITSVARFLRTGLEVPTLDGDVLQGTTFSRARWEWDGTVSPRPPHPYRFRKAT